MNPLLYLTYFLFTTSRIDLVLLTDASHDDVNKLGQLSVKGTQLVDQNGNPAQLKGMSLFWSLWMPQYYNAETVKSIKVNCHSNVVRAAMGIETDQGGYLKDPAKEQARVEVVIEAAIKENIYVIVDWHDHHGENHKQEAIKFFEKISKKYGKHPNILYEIYNEPITEDWTGTIKPYHEAVIKAIRANDAKNIILLGTPYYSQKLDVAAAARIEGQTNIMYVLHFYAGTHKKPLRDTAEYAIKRGIPIFVSEYGTVNADGGGGVDKAESKKWFEWLDKNKLSYVNWAISDKEEGASALVKNTKPGQVCSEGYLTESGKLVVEHYKS